MAASAVASESDATRSSRKSAAAGSLHRRDGQKNLLSEFPIMRTMPAGCEGIERAGQSRFAQRQRRRLASHRVDRIEKLANEIKIRLGPHRHQPRETFGKHLGLSVSSAGLEPKEQTGCFRCRRTLAPGQLATRTNFSESTKESTSNA